MTQALIVRDRYDNQEIAEDLKSYLTMHGFTKIIEISSLNEIDQAKIYLDQNEPCLLVPNIFTRYSISNNAPLCELLFFHKKNKFITTSNNSRVLTFLPSEVSKTCKNNNTLEHTAFGDFNVANIIFNYVYPKEKPMLFLYTHNRDMYLKLTLNSLNFSLIEKVPIKILLNKPLPEVKKVALEFACGKEDYVEVLESAENSFITGTNVLLQYFKPEKFIIMEDDFIFPPTVKNYFPNWPHQFADRLKYFDAVGWSAHIDNVHINNFDLPRWPQTPQCNSDWELITKQSRTLMMAQALAVKTDFYVKRAKEANNEWVCNFDSTLHSHKKCTPSLRGYHIGFNQEMDGFCSLKTPRWPNPIELCHVTSLLTGEKKEIRPKDLLKW